MRIEQCVYGRVCRGLRGRSGFQIAAISEGFRDQKPAQEELQRISCYPRLGRHTPMRPRYAFARLDERQLSLFRTVVAKDSSGSVGYFAHHLIVAIDDIFRHGFLPLHLLREHEFYCQEADLPEDRSLETLEVFPASTVSDESDESFTLALARSLASESRVPVPVFISGEQSDEAVLRTVEATLNLLPLTMAVRLSFCTYFVESSENLACYRFVVAPDQKLLPDPVSSFRSVSADQPCRYPTPYFDWLDNCPTARRQVHRYLVLAGGHGGADENERADFMQRPEWDELPSVLERQWPGWAQSFLVSNPRLFGLYYDRIPHLDSQWLRELLEQDPRRAGNAILHLTQHPRAKEFLFDWVVQQVARGSKNSPNLLAWAEDAGAFDQLAKRIPDLDYHELRNFAQSLSELPVRNGTLHEALARQVLAGHIPQLTAWVLHPDNQRRYPGLAALLTAIEAITRRDSLKRLDFSDISPADYGLFTQRLVHDLRSGQLTLNMEQIKSILNRRDSQRCLDILCAAFAATDREQLLIFGEDFLQPTSAQRDRLVDILYAHGSCSAIRNYLKWAQKSSLPLSNDQLNRLERAATSTKWWSFGRWLWG